MDVYGTVSVCVEVRETQRYTEVQNAWALVISLLRYSFVFYIRRHTHLVKSDRISYVKGDRFHYHPRFTPVSDWGRDLFDGNVYKCMFSPYIPCTDSRHCIKFTASAGFVQIKETTW